MPRSYGGHFTDAGFEEVLVPALWDQATFIAKAGPEIVNQMYAWPDKKGRPICLIPEVTGVIQEMWRDEWSKQREQMKLFYIARCYRYERPQDLRYREFTQVGVEYLGGRGPEDQREVEALLRAVLDRTGVRYEFDSAVARGLAYYTDAGFEARCDALGAQKQIAGGGRYAEGVGWAIGLERLLGAIERS
ncbi:MAG: ATP phosphoribosyltransferase regulatory subunit [Kofleriaceae bacterium]